MATLNYTPSMTIKSAKVKSICCSCCKEIYQLNRNNIYEKSFYKNTCCGNYICYNCIKDKKNILDRKSHTRTCNMLSKFTDSFSKKDKRKTRPASASEPKLKVPEFHRSLSSRWSSHSSQVSDDDNSTFAVKSRPIQLPDEIHPPMDYLERVNLLELFSVPDTELMFFIWLYYSYNGKINNHKNAEHYKNELRHKVEKQFNEFGKLYGFDIVPGSVTVRFGIKVTANSKLTENELRKKLIEIANSEELSQIPHPEKHDEMLEQERISIDKKSLIVDLSYDYEEALDDATRDYFAQQIKKAFQFDGDVMATDIRIVDDAGREVVVRVPGEFSVDFMSPGVPVEVSSAGAKARGTVSDVHSRQ